MTTAERGNNMQNYEMIVKVDANISLKSDFEITGKDLMAIQKKLSESLKNIFQNHKIPVETNKIETTIDINNIPF